MTKSAWTDYDATAANNTDVGGVNIAEGCDFGNMNNMGREIMSHTADVMAGTSPMSDNLKIGDAADLTANLQFDCSGITTATTRSITMADGNVTLVAGTMVTTSSTATLTNKTISGASNTLSNIAYSSIASTSRTGSDAKLVTGTAGTTNYTAKWNADGDLVDGYAVLDEDDMASDSATSLASQQSIKAYVDSNTSTGIAASVSAGNTICWAQGYSGLSDLSAATDYVASAVMLTAGTVRAACALTDNGAGNPSLTVYKNGTSQATFNTTGSHTTDVTVSAGDVITWDFNASTAHDLQYIWLGASSFGLIAV